MVMSQFSNVKLGNNKIFGNHRGTNSYDASNLGQYFIQPKEQRQAVDECKGRNDYQKYISVQINCSKWGVWFIFLTKNPRSMTLT